MALSIFVISVGSYRQVLGALAGCLDRGLTHCVEQGRDPEEVKLSRLAPDMKPFDFQVQAVVHHALGGTRALRERTLGPIQVQDLTYAELQTLLRDALSTLSLVVPSDIDGSAGQVVTFRHGDFALPFTTENFVLAFSLPNLYFHATTAYDLLRMNGVVLGKNDFLGTLPTC